MAALTQQPQPSFEESDHWTAQATTPRPVLASDCIFFGAAFYIGAIRSFVRKPPLFFADCLRSCDVAGVINYATPPIIHWPRTAGQKLSTAST